MSDELEEPGVLNATIDISHHNPEPDFGVAAGAGLVGVIHKASQGIRYVDPTYKPRQRRAEEAGLLWGGYHFGIGGDGRRQADHFLDVVGVGKGTLRVLDFEDNPAGETMKLQEARAFVERVAERTGVFPGLYSGNTIKRLLGRSTDTVLQQCWFWLAQYGPRAIVPPNWERWTLWQYTQNGRVAGIPGPVDREKFNGDLAGLRRLWGVE